MICHPDLYVFMPHTEQVPLIIRFPFLRVTFGVRWKKWTPKSDKIKRRRCSDERGSQRRYTKEFREEALKLVMEGNMSLPKAARSLLLPPSTLGNWLKTYKAGKLGEIGKTLRPLTEIEMELARTKCELVETRMERDLLKKAAAYFARESLGGTR